MDDPRQRYVLRWGDRGYQKVGGGYTHNLQEAEVVGWLSVKRRWKFYIDQGRVTAIPVRIVPE